MSHFLRKNDGFADCSRPAQRVAVGVGLASSLLLLGAVTGLGACSSSGDGDGGGGTTGTSGTGTGGSKGDLETNISVGGGPDAATACSNLSCQQTTCVGPECRQNACAAGARTTVHGTVYDPAGKVPVYNVVVYVPNGEVPPLATGASCDRCDSRVLNPVVSALTDTNGNFVLNDMPVGANIPLVMQVGKWRRVIKIPTVAPCVDTAITNKELTRLPRNKSEGNIPLMAITTGGADSMECLPRRMGIDDAEFTTETGTGRIHLYKGGDQPRNGGGAANNPTSARAFAPNLNAGATFTPATTVWADVDHLKAYDLIILSCEGATLTNEKPATARQAMYDYESLGGRVFASHWHRIWFSDGPAPVPRIGTWRDNVDLPAMATGTIDMTFPKGQALAEWLVNVGASTTLGQMSIVDGRDNVQMVDPAVARQWITVPVPARAGGGNAGAAHNAVEYLSYNAPLNVPDTQQCGRAVFNDLHVSSTGMDTPGAPFPSGCEERDLTAQEKAVEFLLFDLSSCVQNDQQKPSIVN
jgi:hypothetical protein